MNSEVQRLDVNKVFRGLKDFQCKSAKYVFRRLYKDFNKTNRFLIADEVGLGKTIVARGILAKSINFLWDSVKRIDVIYICSNREIASQNISRLNITEQKQISLTSRLTLLPIKIESLKNNKLNFISFTPGTSFDLHSKTGVMLERALIYHILKEKWGLKGTGPINLFQDWASKESWGNLIKNFSKYYKIDEDLSQDFYVALEMHAKKERMEGKTDIKTRFFDLCDRFRFYRKHVPGEDRSKVRTLIGELRMILAQSCLEALEPDIVILDEFQRFKQLLDGKDEMSRLAQHLFNYQSKENEATKIILLSATPYKMYTLHHEQEIEDHYEDFIRTVRFLYNSEEKTKKFEAKLRLLRNEFFNCGAEDFERLRDIKKKVERDLRLIMIRTERLAQTVDRNGMVEETSKAFCQVDLEDLEIFSTLDKLSQEIGTGDIIEYWKSSPYLLNLMDDYEIKRKFKKKINEKEININILKLIKNNLKRMLRWKNVSLFQELLPANAKLKALMENTVDKGSWKMLWISPSLPYYKPFDAFQDDLQRFTKSLIFSNWQIVPKAISMLCSYEAERRMVTQYSDYKNDYREERKSRKPLLIFTKKEERLRGMANLALLYPCLTLASKIDPLEISLSLVAGNNLPSHKRIRKVLRDQINMLLDKVVDFPIKKRGPVDERWYWASLALLDSYFYGEQAGSWLKSRDDNLKWEGVIKAKGEEETETYFKQHVDYFRNYFSNPCEFNLGRKPPDLIEVLTKFAIASPAVVALRSLLRLRKHKKLEAVPQLLKSAALIASGFRTLYNLPESITLIRSMYKDKPYWEGVLDYGFSGNLQAVLDEYVHILREYLGLIDNHFDETVLNIAEHIFSAISLRTIALDFDEIEVRPISPKIGLIRRSIRCRYALRFGEGKSEEDGEITREGQVRAAFNSPFRPFILATTSIGQEGLDFHQYCHSIYHWNLPPNPVDLEQREGRIHRYKGHVIRKNIAKHFGLKKLKGNRYIRDTWEFLFKQAIISRQKDRDDIWPFWVFETEKGFKIERYIPCLPLSRDIERLKDLKRTLVAYRMVFGQPRQEDLIEFLKQFMDREEIREEIQNFRIDLSPR